MAAVTLIIEVEAPDGMLGQDLQASVNAALAKLNRKHIAVVSTQMYRTKALKALLALRG